MTDETITIDPMPFIMTVKRTERGWPAHYISAKRCLFRRNTLLELGDLRIIVSTVGDQLGDDNEMVKIGCQRYYETMCFHAYFDGNYWEADVCRAITSTTKTTIREIKDGVSNEANDMHEAVVREKTERMEGGEYDD